MDSVEVQAESTFDGADDLFNEPIDSAGSSEEGKQPKGSNKVKDTSVATEDTEGKDKMAVRITVHPPELREGKFGSIGSYHAYKVTMVPNEIEHVFRRYKDFEWLRSSLANWFPCLFIPPLPPKRVFGSQSDKFVADRRSDLERFLVRCAAIRHLASSPPFKMFMCRASTFDDGIKEIAAKNVERTAGVVIRDYKEIFPHLTETKVAEDAEQRILGLKEFLENSEKKLSVLADDTQNLANAMNTVTSHLSKITISLDQMYTEEKGFPQKVDPARTDILESVNQWHLGIKQTAPLYETLFAKNFQNELQDIESFLELFKQRDYIGEQQKKQVKKVEKMKTTTGKAAPTQQQLEADQAREKEFSEVMEIITQLMLGSEFQRFWKDRTSAFKSAMSTFASEQLAVAKQAVGLWEVLAGV